MSDHPPEHSSEGSATDDRDPDTPATDDLALTEDEVTRGPFRPTPPSPGEEERFMERADGEGVDPVYRDATSEVDVFEDLPSRRARAEPEEATEDAAAPERPDDHAE